MSLESIKQEMATYFRELPRLLTEGNEGHFVLIKGDQVLSIWDTFDDACQAGYERFGMGVPFLVQPVDRRFQEQAQIAPQTPPPSPLASLAPIKQEVITYLRELPRLLKEGHQGRVAVIKGNDLIGLWDSADEAYEAGRQRFGWGVVFIAQPIDARDLDYAWPEEFLPRKAV